MRVQLMERVRTLLEVEDIDAFNTKLAKLFQQLKKDAGASTIKQNYKGTGSKKAIRQLWINFASGAVIDIWLEKTHVRFGGVVSRFGGTLRAKQVAYGEKTPEQVYAEAMPILRDWANAKEESRGRLGACLVERFRAKRMQVENTTAEATFKKLRDGTWGLLVNSDQVKSGDAVLTITKAGKKETKFVGEIVWSGNGVSICTIGSGGGGGGGGYASEAQLSLAARLLQRLGKSGWHDSDLGQGAPFPKQGDLHNMSSKEISELISALRSELM